MNHDRLPPGALRYFECLSLIVTSTDRSVERPEGQQIPRAFFRGSDRTTPQDAALPLSAHPETFFLSADKTSPRPFATPDRNWLTPSRCNCLGVSSDRTRESSSFRYRNAETFRSRLFPL